MKRLTLVSLGAVHTHTHTRRLLEKINKEKNRCKIYKDSNKSL